MKTKNFLGAEIHHKDDSLKRNTPLPKYTTLCMITPGFHLDSTWPLPPYPSGKKVEKTWILQGDVLKFHPRSSQSAAAIYRWGCHFLKTKISKWKSLYFEKPSSACIHFFKVFLPRYYTREIFANKKITVKTYILLPKTSKPHWFELKLSTLFYQFCEFFKHGGNSVFGIGVGGMRHAEAGWNPGRNFYTLRCATKWRRICNKCAEWKLDGIIYMTDWNFSTLLFFVLEWKILLVFLGWTFYTQGGRWTMTRLIEHDCSINGDFSMNEDFWDWM